MSTQVKIHGASIFDDVDRWFNGEEKEFKKIYTGFNAPGSKVAIDGEFTTSLFSSIILKRRQIRFVEKGYTSKTFFLRFACTHNVTYIFMDDRCQSIFPRYPEKYQQRDSIMHYLY